MVQDLPVKARDARSVGWEYPLEQKMATHSSVLACKGPWTEEPAGLQATGSQNWTQMSASTGY